MEVIAVECELLSHAVRAAHTKPPRQIVVLVLVVVVVVVVAAVVVVADSHKDQTIELGSS